MGNVHNFLYLIWKDPNSRRNYIIGKLTKGDKYTFEYCGEYKKALESGWNLLNAFPYERRYESDNLFAAFASRLPDPKRRDIDNILKKYKLDRYDGYELLKNSFGKLPIDTYEFIDPIFPDDVKVDKSFYLMGGRHYMPCGGKNCSFRANLKIGSELILSADKNNQHDKYAVSVHLQDGTKIGYIPRYYSEGVYMRLEKNTTYHCRIIEMSDVFDCENCIKVKLIMPRVDNTGCDLE